MFLAKKFHVCKVCSGSHKRHNERGATQCYQAFLVFHRAPRTREHHHAPTDNSMTGLTRTLHSVFGLSFYKTTDGTRIWERFAQKHEREEAELHARKRANNAGNIWTRRRNCVLHWLKWLDVKNTFSEKCHPLFVRCQATTSTDIVFSRPFSLRTMRVRWAQGQARLTYKWYLPDSALKPELPSAKN